MLSWVDPEVTDCELKKIHNLEWMTALLWLCVDPEVTDVWRHQLGMSGFDADFPDQDWYGFPGSMYCSWLSKQINSHTKWIYCNKDSFSIYNILYIKVWMKWDGGDDVDSCWTHCWLITVDWSLLIDHCWLITVDWSLKLTTLLLLARNDEMSQIWTTLLLLARNDEMTQMSQTIAHNVDWTIDVMAQ
jgi:hypothetical protein